MMLHPRDVIANFRFYFGDIGAVRWVKIAGKHKVLPNHQPKRVTAVIERCRLIATTAPNADHVHVGLFRRDQKRVGFIVCNCRRQSIRQNPVRAFAKHVTAIHAKFKAKAMAVIFSNQFHRTQT